MRLSLASLALSACAADVESLGSLTSSRAEVAGAHLERLYVATTRASAPTETAFFTGERGHELKFATVDVSVPPSHAAGTVERGEGSPNPAKDFVIATSSAVEAEDLFVSQIRAALAKTPSRRVLIFVHGFNTTYGDSLFRMAQITYDTGFDGVPVLFSWPSRGQVTEYLYDRDSVNASREGLERTINAAIKAGAKEVVILAHSMGTWLTMETLRTAKVGGNPDFGGHLKSVILASPDISIDVFKSQMRRIGRPPYSLGVLISRDDRALRVAGLISGGLARLGDDPNDQELPALGVAVVDLSNLKSNDGLDHSKFASDAGFLQILGAHMNQDTEARGRLSTLLVRDAENQEGASIKISLPKFGL